MTTCRRTALYDIYEKYGGKPVEYAGWEMPMQYEGLRVEHEAVRNAAGIFDVSHMGEIEVKGKDAQAYLQHLVTNDVSTLKDNQIQYTFMCYPDGGMVDDFLIYKFNKEYFYLVVNASNADKDYKWLKEHVGAYDVEVINVSDDVSEIAIQGPKAEEILQELTDTDLSQIGFFYLERDLIINGGKCLVSRTGYTGEDGFEIYFDHDQAIPLWEKLMEVGAKKGLKPAGLGARDTLRFEANLPLYGNEMSKDFTPLESSLGFFVKLNKEDDFIGKDVLVKQKEEGLKRKVVGFEIKGNGIPRSGYQVMADGKVIGFVTTGYKSPSTNRNIGKAMLDIEYTKIGTPIEIKIRKRVLEAEVVSSKFYTKNTKK